MHEQKVQILARLLGIETALFPKLVWSGNLLHGSSLLCNASLENLFKGA